MHRTHCSWGQPSTHAYAVWGAKRACTRSPPCKRAQAGTPSLVHLGLSQAHTGTCRPLQARPGPTAPTLSPQASHSVTAPVTCVHRVPALVFPRLPSAGLSHPPQAPSLLRTPSPGRPLPERPSPRLPPVSLLTCIQPPFASSGSPPRSALRPGAPAQEGEAHAVWLVVSMRRRPDSGAGCPCAAS
jgi:hypothetical protein